MKQQEILQNLIPKLKEDTSVTAVMLMGSVELGAETEASSLDLFILGKKNKSCSEIMNNILIEYKYITYEAAQTKLEKNDMEIYHYIGSKIIFDYDGKLLKLIRTAINKYQNYKIGERELTDLRNWLYNTKLKLNTAIVNQDKLKTEFITAVNSWKIIETVFAINDIPLPPLSRVIKELPNLIKLPDQFWFQKLFDKDTSLRIETIQKVIDWALPML